MDCTEILTDRVAENGSWKHGDDRRKCTRRHIIKNYLPLP
jgi:hypothetical protein